MSYTSGIHKDRIIGIVVEPMSDQSRAKDGFILVRVKPEQMLVRGEYALALIPDEIRTAGFFGANRQQLF